MSVMFSTLFKRLRIDKDLHQREAAEKLGVTQATVSRWECDKGLPMRATESAICELLGIERQTLRESIEESARRGVAATDNEKQRSLDRLMKIPILGSAAAGTPRDLYPDSDPSTLGDVLGILPDDVFAVRVQGYSMTDDSERALHTLLDGSLVLFKPAFGIPINHLIGRVVCCRLEGEEHVIKELQREAGRYVLISWNKAYKPIPIESEETQIEGVALLALQPF